MPIDASTPASAGWWLHRLLHRLADQRPRYDALDAYYRGDNGIPVHADKAVRDAYKRLMRMARTNFAELIVEAVRERMKPVAPRPELRVRFSFFLDLVRPDVGFGFPACCFVVPLMRSLASRRRSSPDSWKSPKEGSTRSRDLPLPAIQPKSLLFAKPRASRSCFFRLLCLRDP